MPFSILIGFQAGNIFNHCIVSFVFNGQRKEKNVKSSFISSGSAISRAMTIDAKGVGGSK